MRDKLSGIVVFLAPAIVAMMLLGAGFPYHRPGETYPVDLNMGTGKKICLDSLCKRYIWEGSNGGINANVVVLDGGHLQENGTNVLLTSDGGYVQSVAGTAPIAVSVSGSTSTVSCNSAAVDAGGCVTVGGTQIFAGEKIFWSAASNNTPTIFTDNHTVVGNTTNGVFMQYNTSDNSGLIGALSPSVAWRDLHLSASGISLGKQSTNYLYIAPASSGAPSITAIGGEGNVSVNIVPRDGGHLQENGTNVLITSDGGYIQSVTATAPLSASTTGGAVTVSLPTNKIAGAWSAYSKTGTESVNFLGPFATILATGKFGQVTCNWGTAGTASAPDSDGGINDIVELTIYDITLSSALCTFQVTTDCTGTLAPVGNSCAVAFVATHQYAVRLTSTTNCTANPQDIFCTVEVTTP